MPLNIVIKNEISSLLTYRRKYVGPYFGYRPFIILSAPRSGSSWLQSLLNSHSDIRCHKEVLNPKSVNINYNPKGIRLEGIKKLEVFYRNHFSEDFFQRFIFCGYKAPLAAVGFKCHLRHLSTKPGKVFLDYLLGIENLSVIHLFRKNMLRSFLSHELAAKHKTWKGFVHTEKISLNLKDLITYFEGREKAREWGKSIFNKKPCLELFYEDLLSHTEEEGSKIQDFLEVPIEQLKSQFTIQEKRPLSQAILNYSEVESLLKGTRWESFLEK